MMARRLKTPKKGRIQMRKTQLSPDHHFQLATRGRSIQKGQKQTRKVEDSTVRAQVNDTLRFAARSLNLAGLKHYDLGSEADDISNK